MKKKFLFMALGVSMLGIMTGNFVKADDEVQEEESIVQPYEHQHRDVGETMYREAARVFAGGDGTENSPYEISSAEELQYLSELLSDPENRSTEYRTQNYILTADISLNDASDYENWGTERPEYDWRSIGAEASLLVYLTETDIRSVACIRIEIFRKTTQMLHQIIAVYSQMYIVLR